MKRLVSTIVLISAAASVSMPAWAVPFKDSEGAIHIQDADANASLTIEAGEYKKKITANFCGLVVVSKPSNAASMPATISVGGTSITVASLTEMSLPKCVDNVLSEARSTDFKTADGRVVVVGKTPGVSYETIFTGVPSEKKVRANACGYAKISNTTTSPAPTTFKYLGADYTTASLTESIPARCITINNTAVKFVPQP